MLWNVMVQRKASQMVALATPDPCKSRWRGQLEASCFPSGTRNWETMGLSELWFKFRGKVAVSPLGMRVRVTLTEVQAFRLNYLSCVCTDDDGP
jgi:hypothetical protein